MQRHLPPESAPRTGQSEDTQGARRCARHPRRAEANQGTGTEIWAAGREHPIPNQPQHPGVLVPKLRQADCAASERGSESANRVLPGVCARGEEKARRGAGGDPQSARTRSGKDRRGAGRLAGTARASAAVQKMPAAFHGQWQARATADVLLEAVRDGTLAGTPADLPGVRQAIRPDGQAEGVKQEILLT